MCAAFASQPGKSVGQSVTSALEGRSRLLVFDSSGIGSDSGQVITGEIGTAATGYTAIGDPAQRMESVAPLASFFKQVTQAVERCDEFSLGAGAQQ